MTELYKRSLTDRREALAKHRPVYFARRKRISVRNYSTDGLFHLKKRKIFKTSYPSRHLFRCHSNLKLFRCVKGSNFPLAN